MKEENHKKIEDWSDLEVIIEDNSDIDTEYYNWKEFKHRDSVNVINNILRDHNDRRKTCHNPVVTLTDCVLDPSDGDFSITINSKDHNWISDDSAIIIADYIEKQLKNMSNENGD